MVVKLSRGDFDWATPPIQAALAYNEEEQKLLAACVRGISVLRGMPQAIEALAKALPEPDNDPEKERRRAFRARQIEQLAKFARKEVRRRFPILHAHATVSLWTALETMIDELIVTFLENKPDLLEESPFSEIKFSLAEYKAMPAADRNHALLTEVKKKTKASYQPGIGRFETLLETISLAGPVPRQIRKDLFELFHVRNLIVHRASIADQKFAKACPWRKVTVGKQFKITRRSYTKYSRASSGYILLVINRLRISCGMKKYTGNEKKKGKKAKG